MSAAMQPSAQTAVATEAVARYIHRDPSDPVVTQRTYMLWAFVHGHSFLRIDRKHAVAGTSVPEWDLLMDVGKGLLDPSLVKKGAR